MWKQLLLLDGGAGGSSRERVAGCNSLLAGWGTGSNHLVLFFFLQVVPVGGPVLYGTEASSAGDGRFRCQLGAHIALMN